MPQPPVSRKTVVAKPPTPSVTNQPPQRTDTEGKVKLESTITNSMGMKLVLVPAGSFQMGSTQQEVEQVIRQNAKDPSDWYTRESPRHAVRITRPFYLGMYEVTVGQFRQFVEAEAYRTDAERDGKGGWGWTGKEFKQSPDYSWRNAGFPQTDQHPVINVSWNDAAAFCQWLIGKENRTYRLPTEAEWEYACRAETTTRWSCGNDPEGLARVANVADGTATAEGMTFNRGAIKARDGYQFTAPVGRYQINAFGLGDMHGNAAEWCQDWYGAEYYAKSPAEDPPGPASGSYRVLRGGSWYDSATRCHSAYRNGGVPDFRNNLLGFRVASVPSGK